MYGKFLSVFWIGCHKRNCGYLVCTQVSNCPSSAIVDYKFGESTCTQIKTRLLNSIFGVHVYRLCLSLYVVITLSTLLYSPGWKNKTTLAWLCYWNVAKWFQDWFKQGEKANYPTICFSPHKQRAVGGVSNESMHIHQNQKTWCDRTNQGLRAL